MTTVEQVRNGLIDKILSIQNEEFLIALDQLIASSTLYSPEPLSDAQRMMLEKSEADILDGNTISQEAMNQRNREWLSGR